MLPILFLLPYLATALPASPAQKTQLPFAAAFQPPSITPAPALPLDLKRRGIISDVGSDLSDVGSDIGSGISDVGSDISSAAADLTSGLGSVFSALGSDIPGYVASGVPNFFAGFPTGSQVLSSLSLTDSDLTAVPTQVLNIPPYANWTDSGWNVRFHGNVFKQPNISESKLDDLANVFLVNTSISSLPESEQDQARNLTSEIFVVQQSNVNVSFVLEPIGNEPGGQQDINIVGETTVEGDYDQFITIANISGPGGFLLPGNETTKIQNISVYTDGTDTGNATAYLVPTTGITIVSDIDDILRITKIYEPSQGLLNSFAKPFVPWMNMPDLYANWSATIPDFHFHYLTTTPEQVTRNYMSFIYATFPLGSFDTRPLNFSDISATLSIRKFLLQKVFETFPQRKFILIADTSNADVMTDYPAMVTEFPGQVQCIWLRNTSATDSGDRFPYDTSGFAGLNQDQFMFFLTPDDLKGLDVANGQCYNSSIPQNLTFGIQGLPDGKSTSNTNTTSNKTSGVGRLVDGREAAGKSMGVAMVVAVMLAGLFAQL